MSNTSAAPNNSSVELASEYLLAGDLTKAREVCSAILSYDPFAPEALHTLGLTLARFGDLKGAAASLAQAIENKPGQGAWHCDLGTVYAAGRQWVRAAATFRQAHELIPGDIQNLLSYARALHAAKQFEECSRVTLLLLEQEPSASEALSLLLDSLWQLGDVSAFLRTLQQFSDAAVSGPQTESLRLSALLHDSSQTGESILEDHRAWGERFCPATLPDDRAVFTNSLDTDRRLRVGYVTGEFTCCPGYHFVTPILRGHDSKSFEIFCYQTRERVDSCGRSLQALGHRWHNVHHLDDESLGRLIRSHQIDVLVDFSGQFEGNRLSALANRLAPVQVFYPNYPATSGLASVDYVLTDQWLCPPGYESNYSEKVYRVPSGYIVYAPPGELEIRDLPARSNGFVTFGLFQRPPKLSSISWDAIGAVLRAVPNARLLVQYDAALRSRFTAELEARGVSGARLDFKDWLPMRERVRLLGEVDIALDTFPYNGQTTTCECLWMGVPVITRSGETHVSRVAGSILRQVGLPDWIAESNEDYATIATRYANDLSYLEDLRTGLRARVAASSLVDAKGKVRELEQAYREMWRAWVHAASSPTPRLPLPTLNAA